MVVPTKVSPRPLAARARSRPDREERMGVVSEIHAWNRGRELQRLRLKYAKMETDAFSFFRGTAHLFFRDWPLDAALDDAPLVWVCGDLHLENFGSFYGDAGRAYFDGNDFDEAALAPARWGLGGRPT